MNIVRCSRIRQKRKLLFETVDIYPVTCERLSNGRSDLEVLGGLIEGGARIVQLREKDLSERDFFRLAERFRERTAKAGMLLVINDRVDVAIAVEADGVHLGREDLPLAQARKIAPNLLIGASSHNLEEALQARDEGADYVNIGPIFPTQTKTGVQRFLGPQAIAQIAPRLSIPFTVMGGIKEANIEQVLRMGAGKVAVVTAITQAPDIVQAVRSLRKIIRNLGS
ncbi:MAG TPA: thiamine phosphate synthase [Syntrophobacteraceae bacterium]|nr:thiamine phosphate synthase [Syntrophobacteraceae bacterium]